jgi:hypothetical protein
LANLPQLRQAGLVLGTHRGRVDRGLCAFFYEISPKQPRGGAASLRRAGDIRTISELSINQVKQHTNASRIAPRFLERRRSLELVEDARPFMAGRESSMSSILTSLASIGFKLNRFSSAI